jgi:hypothetical protein
VISIVAIIVSGGLSIAALIYAHRADSRAARAEKIARDAEARDQQRFEHESRAADEGKRAQIDIQGKTFNPNQGDQSYVVQLHARNLGPAFARHLIVWLVDGDGNRVTDEVTVKAALDVSTEPAAFLVHGTPLPPSTLRVRGQWEDDARLHEDQPLGPWEYDAGE